MSTQLNLQLALDTSGSRLHAVLAGMLAPWLDGRIARGDAPASGPLLAARAGQLVHPRTRRRLADAWERLLTPRLRGMVDPRVPVAEEDVRAAAAEIGDLVAALRSDSPMTARDVARARALLTDGLGPVYRSGQGLSWAVADLTWSMRAARPCRPQGDGRSSCR